MKKNEIELNEVYLDGRGRARLVVGYGPEYAVYRGQVDTDAVGYLAIRLSGEPPGVRLDARVHCRRPQGPYQLGRSTRASFAAWAKSKGIPLTKQRILDLAVEVEWVDMPNGVLPKKSKAP